MTRTFRINNHRSHENWLLTKVILILVILSTSIWFISIKSILWKTMESYPPKHLSILSNFFSFYLTVTQFFLVFTRNKIWEKYRKPEKFLQKPYKGILVSSTTSYTKYCAYLYKEKQCYKVLTKFTYRWPILCLGEVHSNHSVESQLFHNKYLHCVSGIIHFHTGDITYFFRFTPLEKLLVVRTWVHGMVLNEFLTGKKVNEVSPTLFSISNKKVFFENPPPVYTLNTYILLHVSLFEQSTSEKTNLKM